MDESKEEVKTEQAPQSQEVPQITEITNMGQALAVLLQGVDLGREEGIYSWENIEVLAKAIAFINSKVPKPVTTKPSNTETDK